MRFPFNIIRVPSRGLSLHRDGYYGPCLIHVGPWLLNWCGFSRTDDQPGECPF
jgi:subtilase family serine protease